MKTLDLWTTFFHRLSQTLILWIFFSASWWWRPRWIFASWVPDSIHQKLAMPGDSQEYLSIYYVRFALTFFIGALLICWILSGFKGLGRLVLDGRMYWLFGVSMLMVFVRLSVTWASQTTPVADSQAMQWLLMTLFVLIVSAVAPKPRWVIIALTLGMVLHGALGIAQVAQQSDLGIGQAERHPLPWGIGLAEFRLDPQASGVSVIQSRGVRFLRAYGFTPHPNLLGGMLVMSILASLGLWRDKKWLVGVSTFGVWALLLTFSRASMGGFIVGLGAMVALWWLIGYRDRRLLGTLVGMLILCSIVFYGFYGNLIRTRAGVEGEGSTTTLETRSVNDRRVYLDFAKEIIRDYPVKGVGIGNFAWEANVRIQADPRYPDLRGDNVHNIYYLMLAELGFIGVAIVIFTWTMAGTLAFSQWRHGIFTIEAAALWGGIIAWLAIGWFEAYIWALFTHQILFWGVMAVALIPPEPLPEIANPVLSA